MRTNNILLVALCALVIACDDSSVAGPVDLGGGEPTPAPSTDGSTDATTDDGAVSYARDVAPIFAARCNSCHHSASATKLDLTSPFDEEVGLVNRENTWVDARNAILVVPGQPDQSALIDKIDGRELDPKVEGSPMPLSFPALTAEELTIVRDWINDGASPGTTFDNEVARIFGDGATLGSRSGKCAWCHYAGTPSPPNLVDPFDSTEGAVDVASFTGGVRIVPGDAAQSVLYQRIDDSVEHVGNAMPLAYSPLSADQVETIRTWIAEGARDN